MMNKETLSMDEKSSKSRRPKSRIVSSRFLSPVSSPSHHAHASIPSPKHTLSPVHRNHMPSRTPKTMDTRNHKNTPNDVLDRKDHDHSANKIKNAFSLSRQRSCKEFSDSNSVKENHRPVLGGSMRHSGKFGLNGGSSTKSFIGSSSSIVAGRLSLDGNACTRRKLGSLLTESVESESSDICSSNTNFEIPVNGKKSHMSSTMTSRRSSSSSSDLSRSSITSAMKKVNFSSENKGKSKLFSNLRPRTSPPKTRGVEKIINMGLNLFKSKKSPNSSSVVRSDASENVHQLKLLHNGLLQWRFVNAKSDAVNANITKLVEKNLLYAWTSLTKLQQSVVQKRLQLQKEKLEAKLNFTLRSQIKALEAWEDMERQHTLALSMTQECLHSLVCKVPLIEGAKVDTETTSIALGHASDLSASIKSMLASFSPEVEKTATLISELAEVVRQEKMLLQECIEHLCLIATLEIQERTLKCNLIQQQGYSLQLFEPSYLDAS